MVRHLAMVVSCGPLSRSVLRRAGAEEPGVQTPPAGTECAGCNGMVGWSGMDIHANGTSGGRLRIWEGWLVGGIEELESTISGSRTKEHWLLCSTLQCDSDCYVAHFSSTKFKNWLLFKT